MAATDDKATAVAEPEVPVDHPSPLLGKIMFWGLVAWVLGYCGVLLAAFSVQIFQGEFPCPLCMVQRYAMILSSLSALWLIMQARRNTLTPLRYAQGLGMAIVAAILGSWESDSDGSSTSSSATPATAEPSWVCTCTPGRC